MHCPKCGAPSRETSFFCEICGNSLKPQTDSFAGHGNINNNSPGNRNINKTLANRYKVIEVLGSGSMGAVYKVLDTRLNKEFALKEMIINSDNPEQQKIFENWFFREARILCKLRHPNIPVVIDFFTEESKFYMVMDYIKGRNLAEEPLPRPASWVKQFALIALGILSYLHNNSVIHRDIKTNHFIIEENTEKIFLVDFGTARIFAPRETQTAIGTPGFSPPEQYEGKADKRSDLYSLAAVLHHLITGQDPRNRAPFQFNPLEELVPGAPIQLCQVINKALSYQVSQRYGGADEMMLYLEKVDMEIKHQAEIRQKIQQSRKMISPASSAKKASTLIFPEEPTYDNYQSINRATKFKGIENQDLITTGATKGVYRKLQASAGEWISNIEFIAHSNLLAASFFQGDIILWDIDSGKEFTTLKQSSPSGICNALSASPNGQLIVQGIDNGRIYIWDVLRKQKISGIEAHSKGIINLKFLDNNHFASSSGDGTIKIWDAVTLRSLKTLSGQNTIVESIALMGKLNIIIGGTANGDILLWDFDKSSPNPRQLSTKIVTEKDQELSGQTIVNMAVNHFLKIDFEEKAPSHRGRITKLAVYPRENMFLTGGEDGFAKLWKIDTRIELVIKPYESLEAHQGPVTSVAFSPKTNIFVTGGQDTKVKLWSTTSARPILVADNFQDPITDVDFSPNGNYFAAASEVGTVMVWKI
ncbi:MAG: protein kinase domain-containing protein [Vulcanimicrobiota bacterium]